MKINYVSYNAKAFPAGLTELADPPKGLYFAGPLDTHLSHPCVAIVGSRKVSPYGVAVTKRLAKELAERGVVVVSGLALGTDSIAHEAALDAGGRTIAVLPTGLESIYPRSHAALGKRIYDSGNVLVSEYRSSDPPMRHQFLARNRIIAALSMAVLIPEAAERSGSLHTANFALEIGRPVLAVPGNITSDLSRGTNNLIRAGAIPITAVSDVLEALGLSLAAPDTPLGATEHEAILLQLMTRGITDGAELQQQSQLSPALFNQTLTMLEITGKIQPLGAGHWTTR